MLLAEEMRRLSEEAFDQKDYDALKENALFFIKQNATSGYRGVDFKNTKMSKPLYREMLIKFLNDQGFETNLLTPCGSGCYILKINW